MNDLTKQMWAEPHSYEQLYDYIDDRICDDCIRQSASDQVSPQSTAWRKQGWNEESEVRALQRFLEEEEDRIASERRDERRRRRMRRMCMM